MVEFKAAKQRLAWHMTIFAGLLALCAGLVACKGQGGDEAEGGGSGDCPDLAITLDGKETGWSHALAYKAGGSVVTQAFNHDGVTCEEILAGTRQKPDDEQMINVAQMSRGTFVTWAPDSSGGVESKMEVINDTDEPGETLTGCLPEAVTLPGKGPNEGKTLVVQGRLDAEYCGEM